MREREVGGALPTIDNFGLIHFHLLFQNKDPSPPSHPFTVPSLRSLCPDVHSSFRPLLGSLHPSAGKNVALQRFNFRTGSLLRLSTRRYLTVSVSIPPRYRPPPPAAAELQRRLTCKYVDIWQEGAEMRLRVQYLTFIQRLACN